ncbi:MAG: hypothetical protein JNK85_05750 [Verrucomicrobiales bacterium]|nr:hypothetical protein [Verrucomicrobiales bacterium]
MQAGVSSLRAAFCTVAAISALSLPSSAQLLWTVGLDDNGWPAGTAGGEEASFVQENGGINPLPGSPFSTSTSGGADNDYYFAGDYSRIIPGNGEYDPVGVVDVNEEAAERAFAGRDLDLRYHFNLPDTLTPSSLLSVTFDANEIDTSGSDPRFGVEVFVNGVLVQPQILIRPAQLDTDYTTPQFTVESVQAEVGPGADNIVSLRGTSYNSEGGGAWLGIDYVQLNLETTRIPPPTFPWSVGIDDDGWPVGNGGGTNTTFVEGNGSVNTLPGKATSTETAGGADNDYYFAGVYTNVITANGTYEPVGIVPANEEAAERGFAGAENELRFHFNLPNSLQPSDLLAVRFDATGLDTSGADPRYGVEVWVNGVRVMPESLIRAAQLDTPITTPQFTLASVNALVGSGHDNIVTLRGISHAAEGGGNSLGIDYVALIPVAKPIPPPVVPWSVGRNDNGWPSGNGGGPNTSFVQENGTTNPLPGVPNSPEVDQQADNDYYFAGVYSTVIPGNGDYTPVGEVLVHEEAAERAFAGSANELRFHFNLPTTLKSDSQFSIAFDPMNLDDSAAEPRYGVEVYVNNVKVQDQILIRPEQLNVTINTAPFTLAQVNGQVGAGYDNIVSLRGINYSAEGGGNWMGFDYFQFNVVAAAPFPWDVGRDDNGWPAGDGGGAAASFVQEAGVNDLPGSPASPEIDQQADDDYYFAGEYSKIIAGNGDYTPVGTVLVNEEAAERAFAGSDNTKRYHFNLPSTLTASDQLLVTFDATNLDTSGTDPHYGVEIYFNGVLIQPELRIGNAELDVDYTTAPFTLASVNAGIGPGFDNIITLKGVNYSADGGGQWMGIDYLQLNPMPTPVFPLEIGMNDDGWPLGNGGGANASFVQENGSINELPGSAHNAEVNQQADNDYYFAGSYTNIIAANGDYTPIGILPRNEEAAERAFAGSDNDLRYHFNLPSTLKPSDQVAITLDPYNLDDSVEDPHYGVEVYFNNVKVQNEIVIRTNQLGTAITTPPFTLASVNAAIGTGTDNIVSLRGVNYSAEGGGNWMGIDYVRIHAAGDSGEPPKFLSTSAANRKITLTWSGTGNLEWAPAITGPWTGVNPAPTSPFTEDMQASPVNRFYRLRKP